MDIIDKLLKFLGKTAKTRQQWLKEALPALLLCLASSISLADNIIFDCQANTSATALASVSFNNICSPVNQDDSIAGIRELTQLAQDIFNNRFEEGSRCERESDSSLGCKLGSPANPVKLDCTGYNASNGISRCSLYSPANPELSDIISMQCQATQKDEFENPTGGNCVFNINKTPIIEKMAATGKFSTLTGNENAINQAFWSCLSRANNNPALLAPCDRILSQLTIDPDGVADQLITLFKACTPNNTDLSLDLGAATAHSTANNIRTRLTQLRSGYASRSIHLQYFDGQQWLDDNTLLAQNNLSMNDASPEAPAKNISEYGRLGLFLNGSTIRSRQDGSSAEGSHDADTSIATTGLDYRFTEQLVAGIGLNISQSRAEYGHDAGRLDSDNKAIILYGSYYLDNWYIDTNINLARDRHEQQRNIDCSGCPVTFFQSYTARFDGSQNVLAISSGYQWQYGALGITPVIQFSKARLATDGYTEKASAPGPGSNYLLSIGAQHRDTNSIKAGASLHYSIASRHGVFIPLISLLGVHEREDNADTVTGRFLGNIATDATFNLATNDTDDHYLLAAAGLSFQLSNGNAGFIHIQSIAGYDNLEQQQLTAGWRWEI